MTIPNGANLYTQGFGSRPEDVEIPIVSPRAPTTQDTRGAVGPYPIGKRWIVEGTEALYYLGSYSTTQGLVTANWVLVLTGGSGGSGIEFIDGDTGQATGNTVTFNANDTCGETVSFTASGSTVVMHVTAGERNTMIGLDTGSLGEEITDNTFLGFGIGADAISASQNTCVGSQAGASLAGNDDNTLIGYLAMTNNFNGSSNTAVGSLSLTSATGGGSNTVLGYRTCENLLTGTNNIAIGFQAGGSYETSESSNILIGSGGAITESNTIRIGSPGGATGQQNRCFVAGINGVTTTNSQLVTINSSTGQLGTTPSSGTLIQTQTASTVTFLNFTTGISSAFSLYMLKFENLVPASSAVFSMRYSTDGGSNFIMTNYQSGVNTNVYTSATITNTNSTTEFIFTPAIDSTGNVGASGEIFLYSVPTTNWKMISGSGSGVVSAATNSFSIFGSQSVGVVVNALTIFCSSGSGNFSGTVSLYGFA